MVKDFITIENKKLNDYLYHIDARAYGAPRMLSIFVAKFDKSSIIIDCGSSLDTKKLVRFLKKLNIELSSFKYLTTTHHHFDHNGGLWQLYDLLKEHNPEVKIVTNEKTKELLNDYEDHLARGKRTYGNLIGIMKPIEEKAFKINSPSTNFDSNPNNLDFIDTFTINGSVVKFGILKTPGHTPDHQCPIFVKDNNLDFIHLGESLGTIYHSTELVTMPTSMPTYYDHEQYMNTLQNLKNLSPSESGFGHFGVVSGKENFHTLLLEHESFMKEFRSAIIKLYEEKPETRYVFEHMMPMLIPRTDLSFGDDSIFNGIALGIVYGMMMDLGYRKD
ncbi:MAG: MBL fold metallo-hydrolase [Promethearchaeota archaeon]|jgi:glyoxylase-like metal-dependent hydrolase (beta-lactamase superfamily II)